MNSMTALVPEAPVMPRGRVIRAYLEEARGECLRYMRSPAFMLPLMLFPAMFYVLFGVLMAKSNAPEAARYLLASYGAFAVMGPGLFGFGVSLAMERDGGLLTFKRALPMPPAAYLLGKMLMAMLAAVAAVLLLLLLAVTLGGVSLRSSQALALVFTACFGAMPFCAIGMYVGTLIKGQGAPGVLQMLYLPMAFMSGLWIPLPMLPKALQQIALLWPSYHLNEVAQQTVGFTRPGVLQHIVVLAAVTVVFGWLASRRLRRVG